MIKTKRLFHRIVYYLEQKIIKYKYFEIPSQLVSKQSWVHKKYGMNVTTGDSWKLTK